MPFGMCQFALIIVIVGLKHAKMTRRVLKTGRVVLILLHITMHARTPPPAARSHR